MGLARHPLQLRPHRGQVGRTVDEERDDAAHGDRDQCAHESRGAAGGPETGRAEELAKEAEEKTEATGPSTTWPG